MNSVGQQLRMVEADRGGREVAEEVEHVAAAHRVVQPDAVAGLDVLHEMVAVDQDVLGENVANLVRSDGDGLADERRHDETSSEGNPAGAGEVGGICAGLPRPAGGKSINRPSRGSTNAGRWCPRRRAPDRRRPPGCARSPWPGTSPSRRVAAAGSWPRPDRCTAAVSDSVATPTEQVMPERWSGVDWISPGGRRRPTARRRGGRRRRAPPPRRGGRRARRSRTRRRRSARRSPPDR